MELFQLMPYTYSTPFLSICIPTYNRADFLRLCLKRLQELEGVLPDFEIIVSDNASTDHTASVLEEACTHYGHKL